MPFAIFKSFNTRAIRNTRITRIIVGLIGIILDSTSSNTMPTTDSITIPTSNWFHLQEE